MTSRPPRGQRPAVKHRHPYTHTQPMRPVQVPSGQPAPRPTAPRQFRPVTLPAQQRVMPSPMPRPAGYPAPSRPASRPNARPLAPRPRGKKQQGAGWWLIVAASGLVTFALVACVIVTGGALAVFGSGNILPGVHTAGVALGSMSRDDAAVQLAEEWAARGVVLRDGRQQYPVDPAMLGIALDAESSALEAFQYGRASGGIPAAFRAVVGSVDVEPVVTVDLQTADAGLREIAPQVEQPAVNAGVQFVNGQVQERPAANGRMVDIEATLAQLQRNPARALSDGTIDLVMTTVSPQITDASAMVAAAAALLANPLDVQAYDPIEDETTWLSAPPEAWSAWLVGDADANSPTGLRLSLEDNALRDWLTDQQDALEGDEYLNVDDTVDAVQNALAEGQTASMARVYHHDTEHVVQSGETIISIAWDYGVPYPWIQDANPGVNDLTPGQTITVPSADNFMDFPVVYNKRIVVSISEQRARVYENGALKWDWVASTGIVSSPTWPGIYQIISHEPNAYAGNWDLWMPNFMGVYRPIPGADFTNGFHGFPTRGGSQLLWTNSLGTKVTYGCILLSNENVQLLYDWAEEGVVVEIQA